MKNRKQKPGVQNKCWTPVRRKELIEAIESYKHDHGDECVGDMRISWDIIKDNCPSLICFTPKQIKSFYYNSQGVPRPESDCDPLDESKSICAESHRSSVLTSNSSNKASKEVLKSISQATKALGDKNTRVVACLTAEKKVHESIVEQYTLAKILELTQIERKNAELKKRVLSAVSSNVALSITAEEEKILRDLYNGPGTYRSEMAD